MPNLPTPAVVAAELVKTYPGGRRRPRVRALDGLSLVIDEGTVLALLGPNGAGKSTTVRILSTLALPDSGSARVAGIDVARNPDAVRYAIGLVSQRPSSDPLATVRENLMLAARIQGLAAADARARCAELLARFELGDAAGRRARTLSGGMGRKLDIAIGLVHRPRVLFLDEPTTGLDPEARAELWQEIERLATAERVTVLLTTHYLDEADRLADRVAIVDRGRVVASGTPDELKRELRGDTVQIDLAGSAAVPAGLAALARLAALRDVVADGAVLRARADSGGVAIPAVLAALEAADVAVLAVTVARPSLDDVYLRHAGRRFEVAA